MLLFRRKEKIDMLNRCLACQLDRHSDCIDTGCTCLVCFADSKEQDPIPSLEVELS